MTTVRLERSEALQRPIRKEHFTELGIPTVTRILEAIDEGRLSEAKDLVQYLWIEGKPVYDLYCSWSWAFMDAIAEKLGDEELFLLLKKMLAQRRRRRAELRVKAGIEEIIQLTAESLRSHRGGKDQMGGLVIKEEEDRYVITLDPCGSGGMMRRGDPLTGTPPLTAPPNNCGLVQKAYPWTWSKTGVARYCVHCAVNEILEVEAIGFQVAIYDYQNDPGKPCKLLFYKNPKAIPEKYYTRIGKIKPPAA